MPSGWKKNPDADIVSRVERALERSGFQCPCVPQTEWNENTVCPCLKFRRGEGCHCRLYVEE